MRVSYLILSLEQKDDIDLTNIKAVSGTLKDIESIANPQSNKIEVNQQQIQQQDTVITIV